MKQVSLYEAKTNLSSLVEEAKDGEEIVIAKNGKPAARLVALAPSSASAERRIGFWAQHKDWNPPESFPETTQEEIELWENGRIFPGDKDSGA
jgi:prevent-host-death family protein